MSKHTTISPQGGSGSIRELAVVLVGHSYGGAVITEAGNPKVARLTYIIAFALDNASLLEP